MCAVMPTVLAKQKNKWKQENMNVICFVSGDVSFSVDEVVLTCHSLQRIAEQVQDTEEMGRCFHDVIIPRLLCLALQAALQGKQFFT